MAGIGFFIAVVLFMMFVLMSAISVSNLWFPAGYVCGGFNLSTFQYKQSIDKSLQNPSVIDMLTNYNCYELSMTNMLYLELSVLHLMFTLRYISRVTTSFYSWRCKRNSLCISFYFYIKMLHKAWLFCRSRVYIQELKWRK